MNLECLEPVDFLLLEEIKYSPKHTIAKNIKIHSSIEGLPEILEKEIILIGLKETDREDEVSLLEIRRSLYQLFMGNWNVQLVDLGDLNLQEYEWETATSLLTYLLERQNTIFFIGNSQEITYDLYRAYDSIRDKINITTIDAKLDFSTKDEMISKDTYIGKMINTSPLKLENYSNLGCQVYYNAQEELDLMSNIHFDVTRLGDLVQDISIAEPILRNSDMVSMDFLNSVKSSEIMQMDLPNGFSSSEICALARYSGLSDKLSLMGLFNISKSTVAFRLVAQIIWYFIEGYNYRVEELPFKSTNYEKYIVNSNDIDLFFYKSLTTNRWWVDLSSQGIDLLPCSCKDYLDASMEAILPKRWLNYKKKR